MGQGGKPAFEDFTQYRTIVETNNTLSAQRNDEVIQDTTQTNVQTNANRN